MYGESGYDRYLEFQYQFTGDFYTLLFRAIAQADEQNLARLEQGFPQEVHAHIVWTQFGVAPFVARVTAGHPLLKHVLDQEGTEKKATIRPRGVVHYFRPTGGTLCGLIRERRIGVWADGYPPDCKRCLRSLAALAAGEEGNGPRLQSL